MGSHPVNRFDFDYAKATNFYITPEFLYRATNDIDKILLKSNINITSYSISNKRIETERSFDLIENESLRKTVSRVKSLFNEYFDGIF